MSEKNVNLCGMCIFVDGEQPKDPQKFPGVSEVRQNSFLPEQKSYFSLSVRKLLGGVFHKDMSSTLRG